MRFRILIFSLFLLIINIKTSISDTDSYFTVSGGTSIPSSEVNNIFNTNKISTGDTNNPIAIMTKPDLNFGYIISADLAFGLSKRAYFFGGFSLSSFAEGKFPLNYENVAEEKGYILSKTKIYSLAAGIHYYILSDETGVYGIGNLTYNFIANSINPENSLIPLRLENNPTDSRLGFTVGLGLEIPLNQFSIVFESKYSVLNYIGKNSNEETKSLICLSAGFRF
jgi:hypothetical protein